MCVCVCLVMYPPLPMEGKATVLSFFSSARARQFFTVLSSRSSHLSEPQPGLLQWITNLAGRPKPPVRAAGRRREEGEREEEKRKRGGRQRTEEGDRKSVV